MSSEIHVICAKNGLDAKTVMVDSETDCTISVGPADLIRAKKGDKQHCVMAIASCRLPDVVEAFFYRTTTWLYRITSDGSHKFFRYVNSPEAYEQIKRFDATGQFKLGEFRLFAPKGAARLSVVKEQAKKRTKESRIRKGKPRSKKFVRANTRLTHASI